MLRSINPANGRLNHEYPETSEAAVEQALHEAVAAQRAWRRRSFAHRGTILRAAARALRARADELARLMALEMGKPLAQGRAEATKCAWVCDYYAEHAEAFLADEPVEAGSERSYVTYRPLGVVLAVMPWNFPFWQLFRCAAPALMAGNGVLLKHASNVPGCALAIESVFAEAGLPAGLFRALLLPGRRVASLIESPAIAGVALTGSTPAGRAVGAAAGRAIKPSVLELGGSDPYIVLADADLEKAASICVTARLLNSGQTCIAAKRFIVDERVRSAFERLVVRKMSAHSVGDPLDEKVSVGPLARADLRDELADQVDRSVAAGARCLLGGKPLAGPGAFYPVTVLSDVRPGMAAFDEELFGPVAAIVSARDVEDAVALANQTVFGLGAALFTRDLTLAERLATEELDAGCVFVNDHVKSDPRLPFGGIKESGYGRELSSHGLRAFVNVKTVVVSSD
jgi:succinate-semialdehyde dehydrogenase/glutarate-semialdehyde dehydrogenase